MVSQENLKMKTLQEILEEQRELSQVHALTNRDIGLAKISDAIKGQIKSDQTRERMSERARSRGNNQTGLNRTIEQRQNISAGALAIPEEVRKNRSRLGGLAQRGRPKPKQECPYCKQMIAVNMFDRYHNLNCKQR